MPKQRVMLDRDFLGCTPSFLRDGNDGHLFAQSFEGIRAVVVTLVRASSAHYRARSPDSQNWVVRANFGVELRWPDGHEGQLLDPPNQGHDKLAEAAK